MVNRLCCVPEHLPRSHRREKRGPASPQEHLDLWVNYCLIQLRSPKAVGRPSIGKKWNVAVEGQQEPMIRVQRWFFSLTALTSPAELHWISWVRHKNKNSSPNFTTSHWLLQGHSQEQQMLCGSQVSPAESSQGSSRALYCLDSDCGICAACGRWLGCYNYHSNYIGTFPPWRAPWNYSPVTWPGFLILLPQWAGTFCFWSGHKLVGLVWIGRPGMPR